MHSLRAKITVITAAAILASLVSLVVVGFITVREQINVDSAQKMHLLSENLQMSLDDNLDSIEQSVEMASHIAVDSLDSVTLVEAGANLGPSTRTAEQTKELDEHIAEHCRVVQEAFDSVADHTNGVITYYYCISPDISTTVHGFFFSKVGKAGFEEREPLDARELDTNDLGHTTWYYTPVSRGRPSWVGPYTAHFLNEVLTESYVIPIYRAGVFIGVLGMDILFDTMVSQIDSIQVYDTGFVCLLDEDGNVLYHPSLERGTTPDFFDDTSNRDLFRHESNGDEIVRFDRDGDTWRLSFSTLSNGMKLVVLAPTREVVAAWRHFVYYIPLTGLAILALFIPAIFLAVRTVVRPLQRLTTAAAKLSAGDYDVELNYDKQDEVGMLTNSFRQMRDHLKVYISDLNNQAYTDALTRVKNASAFAVYSMRLNNEISQGTQGDSPEFAVVMFDCNGLKYINDRFGHERGDTYLQTACRLICHVFDHSPVFRVGGDEFVALLQNKDYAARQELLDRFDTNTQEINAAADNPWERVDIAKGLAVFHPETDASVEEVLRRADGRMYEDKRSHPHRRDA